ncbi:MAG: hypothetical protein OEZ43_19920 [Gammaproteobacteria bacterium]|nr:hypothetical protein [Gammaproteobacteria bacterium]
MSATTFDKVRSEYGSLSKGVKRLLISGVLAVVYFILDAAIIQPIMEEYSALTRQIEQAKAETKALGMGILELENKSGIDPALTTQEKIVQLKRKNKTLDAQIAQKSRGFVPPEKMVAFIHKLLSETGHIKLESLNNLPVEKLTQISQADKLASEVEEKAQSVKNANQAQASAASQKDALIMYRHGIELTVSGKYLDLVRYIKKLEASPWQISWNSATLRTQAKKDAQLQLVIYTLSMDAEWLRI